MSISFYAKTLDTASDPEVKVSSQSAQEEKISLDEIGYLFILSNAPPAGTSKLMPRLSHSRNKQKKLTLKQKTKKKKKQSHYARSLLLSLTTSEQPLEQSLIKHAKRVKSTSSVIGITLRKSLSISLPLQTLAHSAQAPPQPSESSLLPASPESLQFSLHALCALSDTRLSPHSHHLHLSLHLLLTFCVPFLLPLPLLAPPAPPAHSLLVAEPHPPSLAQPPTAPSPQSPPLRTRQTFRMSLHHPASPPNILTETITISAVKCQTDRRSTGTLSHLLLQRSACSPTSCPPTLQATEAGPPAELKASPKAPHRTHTRHPHPMQPAMSRHNISLETFVAPSVTTSCDFQALQPPLDVVHRSSRIV
ncbi:uncharacterized protein MONOS_14954 [Monocercomonoides exilis]|uniref:uncharacterized protein n=1 Tax=Monocercomonoides exilis TaxID=2049356 RepID=UPI00355A60E2|nr:hypothetical protein MONOS_14954 [Monocercomonoides exilis]|eukprot:MONOS_14954.1-p1 / transcript=MONOS_14954.1 / gene=MONOS_14954 / organism=Monocercomonoides_exilis_PA203 / gene_product=unspecified product / transcript_product=unspecified product / location=Mono_scaffold01114:4905-7204(+) / protein_length=363 / sequence_SO=supercontig / SO=protein_coding / is_pseudo=false